MPSFERLDFFGRVYLLARLASVLFRKGFLVVAESKSASCLLVRFSATSDGEFDKGSKGTTVEQVIEDVVVCGAHRVNRPELEVDDLEIVEGARSLFSQQFADLSRSRSSREVPV